jgi:hypothetical protein
VIGAIALLPVGSPAATTVSVEAEVLVPVAQHLETTAGILEAPVADASDLERGFLDVPEPVVLVVSSNVPWELFVRVASPARSATPGATTVLGRLEGSPFAEIGAAWSSLATGDSGTDGTSLRLRLRLVLSWTEATPGRHQPRLEYRLAPRGT